MKSLRILRCNICMVEQKEILHCFRGNKGTIMNSNSNIFSSCKCGSQFHKFSRQDTTTLRMRMTQKKVTCARRSKQKRRKTRHSTNVMSPLCLPIGSTFVGAPFTPEPASPPMMPFFKLIQIYRVCPTKPRWYTQPTWH